MPDMATPLLVRRMIPHGRRTRLFVRTVNVHIQVLHFLPETLLLLQGLIVVMVCM